MFLIAHGFTSEFYFVNATQPHTPPLAFFLTGPNPPPPPPPPPACTTTGAANQTACDAVPARSGTGHACSWCESKDGIHKLCFDATHKPGSAGWDCDR
eukprot:CAMPEP_0181222236 /NCGR_PEP_ID=MMETSP1096-20121128/29852_1 /TAXON_ID=156174 ORGANISM="Chrysochromulina ericina, Strain CCMP281" /NCGR_SAMPLE_ID=MMETSP1096 /ASSEMBLY_ACC=CAM_ASM_000453 /LENGTH=97 /DNA_ID=CAMNT_0023314971 /DNA_START=1 /DNA_END=294 /DNA_ORIENTATION=+